VSARLGDLLPIGSVVKLKEADKRLVIIGAMQQVNEGEEIKGYDYVGVPYPEGFLNSDSMILFQHEDIENISYLGFADIERQSFLAVVAKEYTKLRENKG